MFACLFAAGVYGSMRVEKGLDLTDVVPRESPEHRFVEAQFKFFSFYHLAAVTKEDFDYANGQELLYRFHDAFRKVSYQKINNIQYMNIAKLCIACTTHR